MYTIYFKDLLTNVLTIIRNLLTVYAFCTIIHKLSWKLEGANILSFVDPFSTWKCHICHHAVSTACLYTCMQFLSVDIIAVVYPNCASRWGSSSYQVLSHFTKHQKWQHGVYNQPLCSNLYKSVYNNCYNSC